MLWALLRGEDQEAQEGKASGTLGGNRRRQTRKPIREAKLAAAEAVMWSWRGDKIMARCADFHVTRNNHNNTEKHRLTHQKHTAKRANMQVTFFTSLNAS